MWTPISRAPKLVLKRGRLKESEKGLTLIELLVALAIVAAMFVVAAAGLRQILDVDLKNSASQIASMLRYLSSKAVVDHRYIRVVYDIDQGEYWVEESSERFLVAREEEGLKEKEEKKEGKKEKETEKEGEGAAEETETPFTPSESRLLKKATLPSGVRFKDVFVDYADQKKEAGQVYTYFFPDGYATATMIHLQDKEDEEIFFSVELKPLSGKVTITREYLEPESPKE